MVQERKKWDSLGDEGSRQEDREARRTAKREKAKAKEKSYIELYVRLNSKKGEKDLYRLAMQKGRAGKGVQQVRVSSDRNGDALTSQESVLAR